MSKIEQRDTPAPEMTQMHSVVEAYPTDPVITGHDPNILMSGLYAFTRFSPDAPVLTYENSEEARELSRLEGREIVLVQLVPELYVDVAIVCMANKLQQAVDNPDEAVFTAVLKGGKWLYDRLGLVLPPDFMKNRHDVQVKRTEDGKLVDPTMEIDFDESVRGKKVWIIEDLGDENLSLECVVASAFAHGASEVNIVLLVNKLSVPRKKKLGAIQIVGLGISNDWMGGIGADFRDDLGREFNSVYIKMTPEEWEQRRDGNLAQAMMGL